MWKKLVVWVSLIYFANSLSLPTDFKTCKRSAENVNECLKDAIQGALVKLENGLAKFKFPSLNPLHVPSMTIGGGTGPVQVTQNFKNVDIYGLPQMKVEKVQAKIGAPQLEFTVDGVIPDLKLVADYDLNGQILVLPVQGNGKCIITLKDVKVRTTHFVEFFEKKGKVYQDVTKVRLELQPRNVEYNFKNLFNGDERLGAEINKVLNENWKQVFEDVKSGYEESVGIVLRSISNLIFSTVPYDEIFPL